MTTWPAELLHDLAQQYGTPLFVYDTAIMERQLLKIKNAFPFPHNIHFSCKSSGNMTILRFFKSKGCGLDTVSMNQVLLGLEAGFESTDIIYTPSGASYQSIVQAHQLGVQITFDNLEHLERFAQQFTGAAIFLRFNPGIIAGGSANVSVGHTESKFGIHISQLPYVLKIVNQYKLKVIGVHVHAGSDIMDANQFLTSSERIFQLCSHFPDVRYVNLGSGFKVNYRSDDAEIDMAGIGKEIEKNVNQLKKELNQSITVIVEPGKFLVSEAGVFIVKVNLVKQTPSATFVFVNSGFNHFLRPMYYNAYHQIENISAQTNETKMYHVVGYLGETDTFGWSRQLKRTNEDDLLVLYHAGAYGYTMASNYNSRCRPAEVLIHEGEVTQITRRETREDLQSLQNEQSISFDDD